jgi:paraquat-inducible protein A
MTAAMLGADAAGTAHGAPALTDGIPEDWRECPHCALISVLPAMCPELVADCPRCHHTLWRMRRYGFELPLACALAAALFYSFAAIAPFLEISAYGRFQLAHIETGPVQLASQGFDALALLVLAVTLILPAVEIGIMLITLVALETRLLPAAILKDIFRWYAPIKPWAMVDVYLLGFLVAYTRLAVIAAVHLDTALFSLVGLMLSMAAANAALDHEAIWRELGYEAPDSPRCIKTPTAPADCVLIGCHSCGLLNQAVVGDTCRRCNEILLKRKPDSIGRSWAFVIAAALLYVPANLYPVMAITGLKGTQDFTIMGGIFELSERGLWPLAGLVFFASIVIPMLKLLLLGYMLTQTQLQRDEHLLGRTMAFRFIDFIGRWSMIDVFMISILVALVRFGQFAGVEAELGAPCFAAVVVLTMFGVVSFDPRVMWDMAELGHAQRARDAKGLRA